jgi:prevent-host-death family protein
MAEIGAFEAKNRLSELLTRAQKGEQIYITRRGKRVAVLVSVETIESAREQRAEAVFGKIRDFRKRSLSGPESLKELVEEGR